MQPYIIKSIINETIKVLSYSVAIILGSLALSHAAIVPEGITLADKQEITRNNFSEPASLDPHKSESDVEFNIIHDFFDGMVYTDQKGNIIPRLAESWETKDNKTWIFHLKKGLKWSDDSPITAHDVVFSWRRLVDPDTISPYGSYLESIHVVNANDVLSGKKKVEELGVKALDDLTLEVQLEKPIAYFLQALTHPTMVPISEKVVKRYGDKWTRLGAFVGSGPFTLSEWVVNEKLVGVRNPHYWDDKNTVINKVTYLPITSDKADLNRYLAGEEDIARSGPLESFQSIKQKLGDQVHITPGLAVYYYAFNVEKPPFNDVRVRQALNLALDRDVISQKVLGHGQISAYDILPPDIGGFNFKRPDYASWTQEQRIAKAKALLNEAGFNQSNPLTVNLLYNTLESHKKIAIAASSMWKKNLGVNVVLHNQEWKVMLDTMHQGNFELVRYTWVADFNSPISFLDIFTSGNIQNTPKYKNKHFDNLIFKAKETNELKYYQQASDIFNHDVPVIPFYYYVNVKLVKPYVGGYYINPMGYISTKDLYIIQH
ncbi:oligopeptide ABC transporter substrate-binding protein OppA [Xenorhabdus sp. 42]|uniref:ABC transporter substrate-binding protein n=1 Tax=Xenorhabdus szentirmaii TaxID=290112 RepID=UPI0019992494|nr:ABC transporter substrate-binding protein [Xenorhabdus sp. 42]MBD2820258.1 oligopeptide ABC transporter substrate-binding protein OppA [Xenorhabdus sp. 42]